jgi:hypothetical protein
MRKHNEIGGKTATALISALSALLALLGTCWPTPAGAWSNADLRGRYSCSKQELGATELHLYLDGVGGVRDALVVERVTLQPPHCEQADSGSSYQINSGDTLSGTIVVTLKDSPFKLQHCHTPKVTLTIAGTDSHTSGTPRLFYASAKPHDVVGVHVTCLKY